MAEPKPLSMCGCDCTFSHQHVERGRVTDVFVRPAEPFQSKMDDWEQCAPVALRYLIDWLRDEPETLMALAKGRVAWGHYRHGDTLMYEFTQDELLANASEELGDAINYIARLIHLRDNAEKPIPWDEMRAS